MPRNITQYRVFIGSPGGLDDERKLFRAVVDRFNSMHARRRNLEFEAVGWEDTLPGGGRPQAIINADLETCDYAVFVFHDRWGTTSGSGNLVGTEEEWLLAERLYNEAIIRNIVLYFKKVSTSQMTDPGSQLSQVIRFRDSIFADKRYLCGKFTKPRDFGDLVERQLSVWLNDNDRTLNNADDLTRPLSQIDSKSLLTTSAFPDPTFEFWMSRYSSLEENNDEDRRECLVYLRNAERLANSTSEVVSVNLQKSRLETELDQLAEAISSINVVIDRAQSDVKLFAYPLAQAYYNKGVILTRLDRYAEAIQAYDWIITHQSDNKMNDVREIVARSFVNKAARLSQMGDVDSAYDVNQIAISLFRENTSEVIRLAVVKALNNSGHQLKMKNKLMEAAAAFEQAIILGENFTESYSINSIVKSLAHLAATYTALGRNNDADVIYNQIIEKYSVSADDQVQRRVASARKYRSRNRPSLGGETA